MKLLAIIVNVLCAIALLICLSHIKHLEQVVHDLQEYQELGCQGHYQGAE